MSEETKFDFRAWRKRMGFTQTEAAIALGVSDRTAHRMDHGMVELITEYACRWIEAQK